MGNFPNEVMDDGHDLTSLEYGANANCHSHLGEGIRLVT